MAASPKETDEVVLLERVLGKLAVTEDDALGKLVDNFLVPILGKLNSPHEGTKKKVVNL